MTRKRWDEDTLERREILVDEGGDGIGVEVLVERPLEVVADLNEAHVKQTLLWLLP